MQKFFNQKNLKIFVPLLVFFFLAGTSMFVVRAYCNSKAEAIIASEANDGEGDKTSDKILGVLTDLLSKVAEDTTDKDGNPISKPEETAPAKPQSKEAIEQLSRAQGSLVLGIVSYVACALFSGFAITCGVYDSYSHSDKYKAKQRRLEVAEKRKASMK